MFRSWLLLPLLFVGCAFQENVAPQPELTPTPIEVEASECLRVYGSKLADAFDHSADQFEQHTTSIVVITEMGDAQKVARIDSFLPLMKRLNELAPKSDNDRPQADASRARVLREWAKQLREVK